MTDYRAQERDRVIALVNEGHTYTEAADIMAMTRNAVAGIIYRHKNPDLPRPGPRQRLRAAGCERAA